MLEKVTTSAVPNAVVFGNISPNSVGSGICYVRGGEHRITKDERPFIKLYLQDVAGACIPGYVFNLTDFKNAGLELTQVISHLVKIDYEENYIPKYGLTIRITKIGIIQDPTMDMLTAFVGQAKEAQDCKEKLQDELSRILNIKITLSYNIVSSHFMEYNDGKVGGLAMHYWSMCQMLNVWSNRMSKAEVRELFSTFLVYIFAHSNYLIAADEGRDDISLVTDLTASVDSYAKKLRMGTGAMEIVHMFFGYTPKDIYVRLVAQASNNLMQMQKEYSLWRTLPVTREGNAGYGIIKRYKENE